MQAKKINKIIAMHLETFEEWINFTSMAKLFC